MTIIGQVELVGAERNHVRGGCRLLRHAAVMVGIIVGVVGLTACGGNEFVPYSPTAEVMPPLDPSERVFLGGYIGLGTLGVCTVNELLSGWDPGPNTSQWRTVQQDFNSRERFRAVSFGTRRFSTGREYDEGLSEARAATVGPCSSSEVDAVRTTGDAVDVIPETLDGLPSGAITSHLPTDSTDAWMAVIGDSDRQILMVVWWEERPDPVPTDRFVEVVNAAWSEFVTEN